MERVAELVRQAATDTGTVNALRVNPESLQSRLRLTGEHMAALKKAGEFPAQARPVTPEPGAFAGMGARQARSVDLPSESLLPPEGQGGFPGAPIPPLSPAPPGTPAPSGASPTPIPTTPPAEPPTTPPSTPPPVPVPPAPAPIPASPPAAGSPQGTVATTMPAPCETIASIPEAGLLSGQVSFPSGDTCCCAAIAGIVSVFSSNAIAALTAITAIAQQAAGE